jgi:hypothetical protein
MLFLGASAAKGGIMRNKAIYLMTLLCVPTAAALIANAPVAVADDPGSSPATADDTDSSPAAPADNTDSSPAAPADDSATSPVCFPTTEVRTAQQAGDVQSACG